MFLRYYLSDFEMVPFVPIITGIIIIIIIIQPLDQFFLAGTRGQSGDRYGSGTLHSGQVLRSSFPLLSPAFKRSHFRR
jgi:hypothetical protein